MGGTIIKNPMYYKKQGSLVNTKVIIDNDNNFCLLVQKNLTFLK